MAAPSQLFNLGMDRARRVRRSKPWLQGSPIFNNIKSLIYPLLFDLDRFLLFSTEHMPRLYRFGGDSTRYGWRQGALAGYLSDLSHIAITWFRCSSLQTHSLPTYHGGVGVSLLIWEKEDVARRSLDVCARGRALWLYHGRSFFGYKDRHLRYILFHFLAW